MNTQRRKAITRLAEQLTGIRGKIEALQSKEQGYYDAMLESLQVGKMGINAEDAISCLQSAIDDVDGAIAQLQEIQ